MNIFKYSFIINLDAPSAWGISFQDSAKWLIEGLVEWCNTITSQIEVLVVLDENIMYYFSFTALGFYLFNDGKQSN